MTFLTGSRNAFVGLDALLANLTGDENVAVGYQALAAATISDLTAVGSGALAANTTGVFNTALGYQALATNITGANNTAVGYQASNASVAANTTAIGYQALLVNTAAENTAVGSSALVANTSGAANTALGFGSLNTNITGANNTALGYQALLLNTGAGNTAVGSGAGATITTGTGNTLVGRNVDVGTNSHSNVILIGDGVTSTASDTTIIGNSSTATALINGNLSIVSTNTPTTRNISLVPTGTIAASEVWQGLHIDGSALDPTGAGADIVGIEVDFSGVDVTNDPVMHGIEISMPERKDAIHIHGGQVVVNNTPPSTATAEFHAHDVRVDLAALASTSAWSGYSITAVGATTGAVDALLVRNLVGVVRQEVGSFVTPSQTEFAGRKITAGTVWADGIDGVAIFAVDDDEVYIGASAQFSQIEVIMGTPATKDVVPTFWYNTAADTWVQFFPDDETSGFQDSSLISWVPSSISGAWTGDGDPGGADTTAGYWIKIIRTRNGSVGTPTPTTMKTGTVVTFVWDSAGDVAINSLNVGAFATFDKAQNLNRTATAVSVNSAGESVIGVTNTAAPRTITLDTDDVVAGRHITVKDESGGAAAQNITVATEGAETIDGAGTALINANYGSVTVYSDGTNWFTI